MKSMNDLILCYFYFHHLVNSAELTLVGSTIYNIHIFDWNVRYIKNTLVVALSDLRLVYSIF